ncbi:PREDICTED: uncharacterized protein LOC109233798 [Nicotiana attenuata]|uniref:uncharacterized protein LOC109233798 n=1 Tax=Nicotiana attenuata TaxID=49451 RepID=UPI0009053E43|nr:PREDICTED: uncharacterized protein LOC109233798 [Nicotiana attenuata]
MRIFQLHRAIATLSQGTDSVSCYFTKLKDLWIEYDAMVPKANSRDYVDHLDQHKLLQFLSGLNDFYDQARRQILMKSNVPSINRAYAMVIEDESIQCPGTDAVINKNELVAMQGKKRFNQLNTGQFGRGSGGANGQFGRGTPQFNVLNNDSSNAGAQCSSSCDLRDVFAGKGPFFTKEQYKQILALLNKELADNQNNMDSQSNMAGIVVCFMSKDITSEWIVDSGATHHIAASMDLLTNDNIKKESKDTVHFPTRDKIPISHTSHASLLGIEVIKGVLYVPDFKFNLLSVSKLTRELRCSVNSFPDFVLFQDLYSGRVNGIDKETCDLYIVKGSSNNSSRDCNVAAIVAVNEDCRLWHQSLGHPSAFAMKSINWLGSTVDNDLLNNCPVCPLAKQTRLLFPTSIFRAVSPFDLVHMDLWGPYKTPTYDKKYYFLTIVDDFSRFTWIHSLQLKSETIVVIKNFMLMVRNQFGVMVKVLRSDNGIRGVQTEPKPNTESKPKLNGLLVWGDKFAARAKASVLIGYLDRQKLYILLELATNRIFVSRDVEDEPYALNQDTTTDAAHIPLRKSSRTSIQPIWLRDYVTTQKGTSKYPITNYISYDKVTPKYQSYLEKFSTLVKPRSFKQAAKYARWIEAMKQEIKALEDNKTWEVVDLPSWKHTVGSKWVYKIKYQANGDTERFKVRLVAKGWNLYQMDVYNAFLQGDLYEEVYMDMPEGFRRQGEQKKPDDMVIILVYVDDLLIIGSNDQLITEAKEILHQQFKLKDLGELKYFMGIEILRSATGVLLNQRKYVLELISEMGLSGAKPAITPLETNIKLTTIAYDQATGSTGDSLLEDVSTYQRLIGRLMYVTSTKPDISYAIHTLSQFMQHPKKSDWEAAIRVVRYLRNSPGQGIWLRSGPASKLQCWCDSDWATCPNTRRLVTGYVVKFGESFISWKSKKQQTVSRSSAVAEYRSMASAVAKVTWLLGLFQELGVPIKLHVLLQCDSKSAIQLAANPIFHERTKYIVIYCHFIRDEFKAGVVKTVYVHSKVQQAYLLTKSLSQDSHKLLPLEQCRANANLLSVREDFSKYEQHETEAVRLVQYVGDKYL